MGILTLIIEAAAALFVGFLNGIFDTFVVIIAEKPKQYKNKWVLWREWLTTAKPPNPTSWAIIGRLLGSPVGFLLAVLLILPIALFAPSEAKRILLGN